MDLSAAATIDNDTCAHNSSTLDNLLSSKASTVMGSLLLGLALVVGLPGNGLVVWTLGRRALGRSCRGPGEGSGGPLPLTGILVLNLAVADSVTLLTAPFWIHFLVQLDWAFGLAACKAFHYVCCLNMYASIFLIVYMSVDRLLAVTRPYTASHLRRKSGRAFKILLGLWGLAAVMAIPAAYYRSVRVGKLYCRKICEPIHPASGQMVFHYLMETGLGFLVPLAVLVGSYGVVGRRVRTMSGRRRTGRLIVALLVAFTLFWLPYHAVNLAQVGAEVAGRDFTEGKLKEARPVVTCLAFVSCSVNPVLYAFSSLSLLRQAGPNFVARMFEGTTVDQKGGEGGPEKAGGRRRGGSCPDVGLNRIRGSIAT